jgi:hypothetical protein
LTELDPPTEAPIDHFPTEKSLNQLQSPSKTLKSIQNTFSIPDIQEFYEVTLLDESKTVQQKTAETLLIASKWEHENTIKTDVS